MERKSHKPTNIPMNPLPSIVLQKWGRKMMGIGGRIAKAIPNLKLELEQADIELEAEEYASMGLIVAFLHFVLWSLMISVLVAIAQAKQLVPVDLPVAVFIGPGIGFVMAALILVQVSLYPSVRIKKKIRDLERNLLFGLRTITVQIRSGVTLFDALSLIADGNYGYLSTEFKRIVNELNTGVPEEDALQRSAVRNPSVFYRRAVWQIVNGMKAGADITMVLSELVRSMTKEQVIQIKKYGSALKLLSLIYMMLGVIIPALGLTFMIILSTFPQIPITQELLWAFLGALCLAQIMFVGLIKSKRPSLLAEE